MKTYLAQNRFQSAFALGLAAACIAFGASGCHRSDAHKDQSGYSSGNNTDSSSDKFGGSSSSQQSTANPSDAHTPTTNSQSGQNGATANAHDPNSSPNPPAQVSK